MYYNARWYDPYLNHMTQPDSIVPDPGNPQAWNRYSYALNNPVRYTDTTGHWVDSGCGSGEGCELPKTTPPVGNGNGGSGDGPSAGAACQGQYQSILCLPTQTLPALPTVPTEIWLSGKTPGNNTFSPLDPYAIFFEFLDMLANIDTLEDAILFGRPIYKQIKYAGPLGAFEYGADTALQVYDDWDKDLMFPQRSARATFRFLESFATDGVSVLGGSVAGGVLQANVPVPLIPAGVGYFVGASATSGVVDNWFVYKVNPWLFNFEFFGGVE